MFTAIVSADTKNGIGLNGKMPWHCPDEAQMFKRVTMGSVIIMGRVTLKSIGHTLPGRINVVISSNINVDEYHATPTSPLIHCTDLESVVKLCTEKYSDKKWFVIGGEQIYDMFYQAGLIGELYLTRVFGEFKCDKFFKWTPDFGETPVMEVKAATWTMSMYRNVCKNSEEQACLDLMSDILTDGNDEIDRTKVGTKSLFGKQLTFNLRGGRFPLMTTRKMFLRGIFEELMLMISGESDNEILVKAGVKVWVPNTTREFLDARGLQHLPVGDMGPSYGFQMRHFGAEYKTCHDDYTGKGTDQLTNVINLIKNDSTSRRMVISLWNPSDIDKCPLPPCLYNYQFYVSGDELSCMMTQRSSDFAVAGGWNIATGALLTYLIATVTGKTPGDLIWNIGDVHIYKNLVEQVVTQVNRVPRPFPKIKIYHRDDIERFVYTDLTLENYYPLGPISMTMNA